MSQNFVKRMDSRIRIFAVLLFLGGCAQSSDREDKGALPLVQIADYTITLQEFVTYEKKLPERLRSSASGIEARYEHLQGLVDRQLMLLEGERKGYRNLPELKARLEKMVHQRLIEQVTQENVDQKVSFTKEELKEAYERYNLGWMVWPARILVETEEEARQIVRQLEEGGDFSRLAREHSLAEEADRGGEMGGFFRKKDTTPPVQKALHDALSIGEVSEPVRTGRGYEIFKLLDKKRMPFDDLRDEIAARMRTRKWVQRRYDYVEELKRRFGVVYHVEHTPAVLEGIGGEKKASATLDAALITFQGSQLRTGTVIALVKDLKKGPLPADSLALFGQIDRWILSDSLMVLAARQSGLGQDSEFLAWKERTAKELMVEELRTREVLNRIEVSQEEVRQFYEEQIDQYSVPGEIYLTEVLVNTWDKAAEVLHAEEKGESLEELARKYSVRPKIKVLNNQVNVDENGHMTIGAYQRSAYRGILESQANQTVGQLQGPIETEGRFAIIRLDQPIEVIPLPYEKVRRHVRYKVKKEKSQVLFEQLIESLRENYAGEIKRFDENIANIGEPEAL